MNLQEIRQKYPQYADLSDDQLAQGLHKKHYADMPYEQFAGKIGLGAAKTAPPAPAKDESNIGASLAMGARQAWDAGAQVLGHAVSDVFPSLKPSVGQMEADMRRVNQGYQETFDPAQTTGNAIARGFGQAGVTGPLAPAMRAGGVAKAVGQGGAIGAGAGALTPVYDVPDGSTFWGEKRKQMGLSAGLGSVLGGAGNVLGKAIAPKLDEGAKALLDAKIPLTPGQTLGGMAKSVEDRLAGFPIVGDLINRGRRESLEGFNRAIYQRAVEKFGDEGKALVKGVPVGHEGIKAVGDFLSAKYEDALSKSVPAKLTPDFGRSLNHLKTMVPKALQDDFQSILDNAIQATPAATITPSVAKAADSMLGQASAGYKGSATEAERALGRALAQAQSELRQLFARSNPQTAAQIRAADHGWKTIVQMEKAGAMLGAEGIFTAAQFKNAVKSSDKSLRDRASARGEAWNQEFAETANRILPNKVPDAGTAGRASMVLPFLDPTAAAVTLSTALPYLPGASQATRALLSKRPEWAAPLAEQVKLTAPYLGLLGPLANQ